MESLGPEGRRDLILRELRSTKAMEGLYVHPTIPPDKLTAAQTSCKVPEGEEILGLIDATIFGSAENALLFGKDAVYYHNDWTGMPSGAGILPYSEFPTTVFQYKDHGVSMGRNCAFRTSGGRAEPATTVDLFSRITKAFLDERRRNPIKGESSER